MDTLVTNADSVDLIREYTLELFGKIYPTYGNAKELWYKDWWIEYTKHVNTITFLPKVGDIVIWGYGTYWHIAIVTDANLFSFNAIEQNAWNWDWRWEWSDAIRIHTYYYKDVLWFIRHKSLTDNKMNIFWKDITRSWYSFPSSIYWIPVQLRTTSQERLLALSYIEGYTPGATKDIIYITENLLKLGTDRVIKTLYHEFEHFIQHIYYTQNQKDFLNDLYMISKDEVFTGSYSQTNHWELWAEVVSYGIAYIDKNITLPEWKEWAQETQIVYGQ